MKNKNINTELPLFESDNYKRNFPEDFEWGIYSELSSTKVTEDLNIVRKKTGFNEGWEMSLPDSNNIQ